MPRIIIALIGGVILLTLFLDLPGLAQASERQTPRYELSPFAGIIDFDTVRGLNGNIYGGRFAINATPVVGFEVTAGMSRLSSPRPGFDPRTIWMSNLDLVLTPVRGPIQPYVSGGLGSLSNTIAPSNTAKNDVAFDAGGGLKMWFHERVGLRADVRTSWASVEDGVGIDQSYYRDMTATVGLTMGLGGIPGTEPDGDQDGVSDTIDRCSETPFGILVDSFGCPPDADRDGVADHLDNCAGTAARATVDGKGCPSDSDMDGVFDGIDVCTETPKLAMVDAKGCPIDSDRDGVFDGIDRCAGTPAGQAVNTEGCGQTVTKPVKPIEKWLVLRNVTFVTGKAVLTASSKATLDEIAATLAANPEIKIEIRGHTDAAGSDEANLDLSQRRAESVRQYFIVHGVDAARLRARGIGEIEPVAGNDTPEGRAMNRRVEVHRID